MGNYQFQNAKNLVNLRTITSRCFTIETLLPAIVIGSGLFMAIAFCAVFRQPHSYDAASLWIYQHAPRGSIIAGVHWDDRLPVSLPGFNPQDSHYNTEVELPLYEADTPAKTQLIANRVASSNYIVLPTQRLQGSLLRVPDEYPQTASFFRQLFAGQLGFKLEKTFKPRLSFLGITFNDDLADESLSVYDHPKVSIFKNMEHLPAAELLRRIQNPPFAGTLPSLNEVMREDAPASNDLEISHSQPQFVQVLMWLFALEFLTWAVFPIIAVALPEFPDRGFGIAKTLSLLLVGVVAWQCSSYQILKLSPFNLWALVIGSAIISQLVVRKAFHSWREFLSPLVAPILGAELIWFSLFALFTVLRAFQPEIFWGEKPMDFTFLNYFVRLDFPPPHDPWAAGEPLNYYYLGVLLFAFVHKLSGVSTAIGYNLSLATLAAMIGSGGYCVFARFGMRLRTAILLGCALLLLANLEVIRLAFYGTNPINFDLFWAATRLFTEPGFAEYPLWSLLFGDLHAHVIALPFAISFIALCAMQFEGMRCSFRISLCRSVLTGISLGGLFLINAWDLIAYSLLLGFIFIFRLLRSKKITTLVFDGVIIAAAALLTVLPFLISSGGSIKPSYGWVQTMEFNNLWQVLRHLGIWIVLVASGTALLPSVRSFFRFRTILQTSLVIVLTLVPFALGFGSQCAGFAGTPWDIASLASLLILCGGLLAVSDGEVTARQFSGVLILTAGIILSATEFLFLQDRMNTIFKFYNPIWLLLGIATLGLVPRFFSSITGAILPGIVLLSAISGSALDIYIMTTFQRISGFRPTLDGDAYLASNAEMVDDLGAIQWINNHISGTPVMLEAQGDSYREFTRISMHTGLPTVLGWEYHVSQRGTPQTDIFERKNNIRLIYDSADAMSTFELLRRYNVQLIIVGQVEKKTYTNAGLAKFENHPELFTRVFENKGTRIYATHYAYALRENAEAAKGI